MPATSTMNRLRRISVLLDSQFKGPFGFRFGLDGILGLIPVVGDLTTTLVSFYILIEGALLGAPPAVLIRMGINILIENIVDCIPVIGNIFDFFWKSNTKNIRLLERHQSNPRRASLEAKIIIFIFVLLCLAFAVGSVLVTFYLLEQLYLLIPKSAQLGW